MVNVSPVETISTGIPASSIALATSMHIRIQCRPSLNRVSLSGSPAMDWWLITPLNVTPGNSVASRASSMPCSVRRIPARSMDVFTSITTPTSDPPRSDIDEISRKLRSSSTATFMSADRDRAHTRAILSGVTTWLVISMSLMPPSIITSASDTLAAHTPPTVPPDSICL